MDILRTLVLAVIEGLTEFLPVSSTGHMVLAYPLLQIDPTAPLWRTLLFVSQVGPMIAVLLYFRRDIWQRLTVAPAAWHQHLLIKIVIAFLPAAVVGLTFDDFFEPLEESPLAVGGAFVAGAILLEIVDRLFRRSGEMTLDDVTFRQAAIIGLVQCLAIWPGMSRAGCTIMGGLMAGLTPRVAAQFSFYLAVPTLLGAALVRAKKFGLALPAEHMALVGLGTFVAFLVALGVIATFLPYVQKHRFTPFVVYRIAVGVAVILWANSH